MANSPRTTSVTAPLINSRPHFLMSLPGRDIRLYRIRIQIDSTRGRMRTVPTSQRAYARRTIRNLNSRSLLVRPLQSRCTIILIISISTCRPNILGRPIATPDLRCPTKDSTQRITFGSLTGLLIKNHTRHSGLLLRFNDLAPLCRIGVTR